MLTVAWDVDDVLNDLTGAWLEHWRSTHPGCRLRYDDLTENPPHLLLGISRDDYLRSLDVFRASAAGTSLRPDPGVSAWFGDMGASCRHLALTATPLANAPASAAWVMRHFGVWVRGYVVVPSPRPDCVVPDYDADKGQALDWLRLVDVLVDDSPAAVEAARNRGRQAVLVPRPWNAARGSMTDALDELTRLLAAGEPAPTESREAV